MTKKYCCIYWYFPWMILALAAINNAVTMHFEDGICNDAVYYHSLISNWIKHNDIMQIDATRWNVTAMPPFWLWLVKNISQLFDIEIFTAARIINFVAGTLTPLMFYYCIRVFDKTRYFAFFCAIVAACHPTAANICSLITRDCVGFFLTATVILLMLLSGMKYSIFAAAGAGILLALAILTRYESIETVPCLLIFLFFCVREKQITWRQAFIVTAVTMLALSAGLILCSFLMGLSKEYHLFFWERYWARIVGFF